MTTTTIRLEEDLKARVAAAAHRQGKTAHAFILDAIAQTVEQAELDEAFRRVAEERWTEVLDTGKTVPWDAAKAYLEARALGDRARKPAARKDAPQLQLEQPRHAPSVQKSMLLIEIRKFTKELTPLQTHDRVTKGIGVADLRRFMGAYHLLATSQVLKVIGTSERTLQRAAEKAKPLDMNVSDRALRLATVTSQAMDVLGSQEAAERWLSTPALGLDGRKPIDLLQSTQGTELVKTLLTRMDYGVYA